MHLLFREITSGMLAQKKFLLRLPPSGYRDFKSVCSKTGQCFFQGFRRVGNHGRFRKLQRRIFAVPEGVAGQNIHFVLAVPMQKFGHRRNVGFGIVDAGHERYTDANVLSGGEQGMQIFQNDRIVTPGQPLVLHGIHVLAVVEEEFNPIHDLFESFRSADAAGIQTDMVAAAG